MSHLLPKDLSARKSYEDWFVDLCLNSAGHFALKIVYVVDVGDGVYFIISLSLLDIYEPLLPSVAL